MPVALGSAYGEIVINTAGVAKGINDAQRSVSAFQQTMSNIGNSMSRVGKALTLGVTLPLLAIGKQAVTTAADFEAQMNILGVAARNAGTSMEDLRSAAVAVGADTRLVGVSASEAADAMTNFYKAGMSTTDVFGDLNAYLEEGAELSGALRAAVDLAAASDLDLAAASDAVAVAMATFGLEAEEATRIADSFVQAADASVAEVGDLVAAMENVGPTAAAFGWSLEDVNTALALLSERGIRGAEAGTALKSMMTNLMRTTPDVVETLAALNVELYNTDGTMRSLPQIIGQVADGMAHLTDEQRNQAVQTLAGTYGMKAMNTLLAEGVDGWADMEVAVGSAATAQEVAAERTEGLAAAWEQFTGVLETLLIEVGTPLIQEFLTPLVNAASEMLSAVQQQHPEWLKWGAAIGIVAAAVGPLLIGLGQMLPALAAIGSGLGAIVGVVGKIKSGFETVALGAMYAGDAISGLSAGALLGPLGLVAGLGAVVVGAVALAGHFKKLEEAHREESASILSSTETYGDYIRKMEQAGREGYTFTESLYEMAKAKQEVDASFDTSTMQNALKELGELGGLALGQWNEGIPQFLDGASDMAVAVAQDRDQMVLLAEQLGYNGTLAEEFASRMTSAAQAVGEHRAAMEEAYNADKRWADHILSQTVPATEAAADGLRAYGGANAEVASSLDNVGSRIVDVNEALMRQNQEAFLAAKAERELAEATAAAAEAQAQFGSEMDLLHEAMSGTIGPDFEALAAGYAELREALATGAEGIDEMTAAMERQREAFQENTNAVIYNIAEKQIMDALEKGLIADVNASGTAYDEASGSLVRLAEKLGLVDQGTVLLTEAVSAEVEQFIRGEETAGAMAGKLDTLSGNLADAAQEGDTFNQALRTARVKMEEGETRAGLLAGKLSTLAGELGGAAGEADGLRGSLDAIPRNINVEIGVRTTYSGGPPPVLDPVTGTPVVSPTGTYAKQHGGPVQAGGAYIVGEAGPEVFMPRQAGYVLPNPLTQALMALAGSLERSRAGGLPAGEAAGQYMNIYGGLHLAGVNDMNSLLGELHRLSI